LVPSILLVLGSIIRLIGIARHDVKTLQSRWHVSKLVPIRFIHTLAQS
jgi:hypothetical protein